jgi:hypothetical protein
MGTGDDMTTDPQMPKPGNSRILRADRVQASVYARYCPQFPDVHGKMAVHGSGNHLVCPLCPSTAVALDMGYVEHVELQIGEDEHNARVAAGSTFVPATNEGAFHGDGSGALLSMTAETNIPE